MPNIASTPRLPYQPIDYYSTYVQPQLQNMYQSAQASETIPNVDLTGDSLKRYLLADNYWQKLIQAQENPEMSTDAMTQDWQKYSEIPFYGINAGPNGQKMRSLSDILNIKKSIESDTHPESYFRFDPGSYTTGWKYNQTQLAPMMPSAQPAPYAGSPAKNVGLPSDFMRYKSPISVGKFY